MKHINIGILRLSCGAWLMVAAAPFAGAQTSSAAPAPAASPAAASPAADAPAAPVSGQSGYLFGLTFGEQLHNAGVSDQVSIEDIERGLKDGLQGKKSTQADRQQIQEFVRAAMASAITRNQTAAKDFLARNGHEKGVTTTASGLEYKVISAGDRKAPAIAPTDSVTVQYRGKLIDGTEFDSTYTRGAPASFTVNGVIPGWQEALVLMKPGAKWQLFVPPELAYGARPQPGIPGGSLLIFDVELVSVKSSAAPAAPAAPAKPAPKAN
jgi:FKBP-type peptidyl-prolyl cis-trans isomerase FklB